MTAQYLGHRHLPVADPGQDLRPHPRCGLGVGLLLVQVAKLARAPAVIGIGVHWLKKRSWSRNAGADHVVNYVEEDFEAAVKHLTGGTRSAGGLRFGGEGDLHEEFPRASWRPGECW